MSEHENAIEYLNAKISMISDSISRYEKDIKGWKEYVSNREVDVVELKETQKELIKAVAVLLSQPPQ